MTQDEFRKEITSLHEQLRREISSRNKITVFIEAKINEFEKKEYKILDEINDILNSLQEKSGQDFSGSTEYKIELTKFKNNIRKLIKEFKGEYNEKLDLIYNELKDSITNNDLALNNKLSATYSNLSNSIKTISENISSLKETFDIKTKTLTELSQKNEIQNTANKENIKSLKKEFVQLTDKIDKQLEKFSETLDVKNKAVLNFYDKTINKLKDDINEMQKKSVTKVEIVEKPAEKQQNPNLYSGLQKEINTLFEQIKELHKENEKFHKETEKAIHDVSKGTPEVVELLEKAAADYKQLSIINESLHHELSSINGDIRTIQSELKTLVSNFGKMMPRKKAEEEIDTLKIIIAEKIDTIEKKTDSKIKELQTKLDKANKKISEKDEIINGLQDRLNETETKIESLEKLVLLSQENINLLLSLDDGKDEI